MSTLEATEFSESGAAVDRRDGRPPENWYLDARRHWNSEVERAFASGRTWQVIGILSLVMFLGSLAVVAYLLTLPRFVPYVVEVNELGEATAIRQASQAQGSDPRIIRAQLSRWIDDIRSVTPDVRLQRKAVDRVTALIREGDPAYAKLCAWWNQNDKTDPYNRAAHETVAVTDLHVLPLEGAKVWQAEWLETTYPRSGPPEAPVHMKATLHVFTMPPGQGVTEDQIQANPTGLYLQDFTWLRLH